jgi:hypothetical protein
MKTYEGTFQSDLLLKGNYTDTVQAPCKWIAWLILKSRNSAKMISIKIQKL